MKVTKHPSTQRRLQALAARFTKLRQQHETAIGRMWAGTLALYFTDDELAILSDYLSPHDEALLRRIRTGK